MLPLYEQVPRVSLVNFKYSLRCSLPAFRLTKALLCSFGFNVRSNNPLGPWEVEQLKEKWEKSKGSK